jgi:hypothetical protein
VNAGTIGAEARLPYGGMKQTGNGHRESGVAALEAYTIPDVVRSLTHHDRGTRKMLGRPSTSEHEVCGSRIAWCSTFETGPGKSE